MPAEVENAPGDALDLVEALAAAGYQPVLGQAQMRWSWTEPIPAGSANLVILDGVPFGRRPCTLRITSQGGPGTVSGDLTVTVTQRWQRSVSAVDYHLGAGGEVTLQASGAVYVAVQNNDAVNASEVGVTILPSDQVADLPDYDGRLSLAVGGGAAPGTWTDCPSPTPGYPPHGRKDAWIFPSVDPADAIPGVEFRLVGPGAAGNAVPFGVLTAPQRIRHPPRYRLQARHPGGAGSTPRECAFTWWRS